MTSSSSYSQKRQSELFAGENWNVAFKAFSTVNLKAYDYDTIKSALIQQIQTLYPENYTDWVSSSEFVFIIDMLAYLGQSLAFRIDLNARENFLDTAERRESIIKLAKSLGYTAKRNYPARGLVKLQTIQTDQPISDSLGNNLNNVAINWNDSTNVNWYDQFIQIVNTALQSTNPFGLPIKTATLTNNVVSQLYQLNSQTLTTISDSFNDTINGQNLNFELVNPDIDNDLLLYTEISPDPLAAKKLIYQYDGAGNSSPNTGFFGYFKQGTLDFQDFQFTYPIENRIVDINVNNINQLDVWVQEINNSGLVVNTWTMVPTTDTIAFNSIDSQVRTIFSVISRDNDQISIKFGDGRFGTSPTGLFRIWYRTSLGSSFDISTNDLQNIQITIPYFVNNGNNSQPYNLTLTYSLQYPIGSLDAGSSVAAETANQIQTNANQVYYTQNRMVNGQDYNVFPLQNGNTARKIKAINRTYSGQSRYIDINDPTGSYQNTKLFSDDGIIYEENFNRSNYESLPTIKTALEIISSDIQPLLNEIDFRDFYLANTERFTVDQNPFPTIWYQASSNSSTGEFQANYGSGYVPAAVGVTASNNYKYITSGSLVKFNGPTEILGNVVNPVFAIGDTLIFNSTSIQNSFSSPITVTFSGTTLASTISDINNNGSLITVGISAVNFNNQLQIIDVNGETLTIIGTAQTKSGLPITSVNTTEIWCNVNQLSGNGISASITSTGIGPVQLNQPIPSGYRVTSVIPSFNRTLTSDQITTIQQLINSKLTFALRYDISSGTWIVVTSANIDFLDAFSYTNAGDSSNSNLDASWLLLVQYLPGQGYWSFTTRNLRYIFESVTDARFYFISNFKVVDSTTGLALSDNIKVLKYNTKPIGTGPNINNGNEGLGIPYQFDIINSFQYPDGYTEPRRVQITFPDTFDTGNPDNPDSFLTLVDPQGSLTAGSLLTRYVYQTSTTDGDYQYWDSDTTIVTFQDSSMITTSTISVGSVAFAINQSKFYLNSSGTIVDDTSNHQAFLGRNDLDFQWNHYAPADQRIDPTFTNIIDTYVLTENYYQAVQTWLNTVNRPLFPDYPTSDALRQQFSDLLNFKMISDEMIFSSAKFKLLFGSAADEQYQCQFKVVKVPGTVVTNNEIQQRVITAINQFFNIDLWNFGETFFATELIAYLHQQLATVISSIVIVPKISTNKFGNLFEIQSDPNELFLSVASVSDIIIVDNFTQGNLNIGN